MHYFRYILFVTLLCSFLIVQGQDITYQIDKVEVTITGGSTLHDWTVKAEEVFDYQDQITIDMDDAGEIGEFGCKIGVATMDGGRGAVMNNKIHKALKSDLHPYVKYEQTSPANYEHQGDKMSITSSGVVSIGGVDREVVIEAVGGTEGEKFTIAASHPMKLSDFDIEPPSAMFGQIQTKDDIVVHFNFIYNKN